MAKVPAKKKQSFQDLVNDDGKQNTIVLKDLLDRPLLNKRTRKPLSIDDKEITKIFESIKPLPAYAMLDPAYFELDPGKKGLKSPLDVIRFLKSPAGKTVINTIARTIHQQQEDLKLAHQYHQKLKNRKAMAFLIIGLLFGKSAEARSNLNRIIEAQIQHRLKEHRDTQKEQAHEQAHEQALQATEETLQHSMNALENAIKDAQLESDEIEQALDALEVQETAVTEKYNLFDKMFVKISDLLGFEPDESAQANHEQDLEEKAAQITQKIEAKADEIASFLDNGDEATARVKLLKNNARQLQLISLQEKLDVLRGRQRAFDDSGEETRSTLKAAFVLPSSKKIVLDNGKAHLIDSDKVLNDLTAEEKARAADSCKKLLKNPEPRYMCVNRLVRHNYHQEFTLINVQKERLNNASLQLQRTLVDLTQQYESAASHRAELQQNRPRPKMGAAANTQKPQEIAQSSYMRIFKRTVHDWNLFVEKAHHNKAMDPAISKQLKNPQQWYIAQGQPISEQLQTMRSIIKYSERSGIDMNKPNVAGSLNPTRHYMELVHNMRSVVKNLERLQLDKKLENQPDIPRPGYESPKPTPFK